MTIFIGTRKNTLSQHPKQQAFPSFSLKKFTIFGCILLVDLAINQIAFQLNQYLKSIFDLTEDVVVVSNILEQDGTIAPHVNNKVLLFIVNIEKDSAVGRVSNQNGSGAHRTAISNPPVYLNLYMMAAGYFNQYTEALKFISNTISFFQRHPIFDHQNTPELDEKIEKLVLDIENLDIKDLSTLWGVLSGKYLPSILYKVRMVAFDAGDVVAQVPTLREPRSTANQ